MVSAVSTAIASSIASAFGSHDAYANASAVANATGGSATATAEGGSVSVTVAPPGVPSNLCECIMAAARLICQCIRECCGQAPPSVGAGTIDTQDWADPDDWWTDADDSDEPAARVQAEEAAIASYQGSAFAQGPPTGGAETGGFGPAVFGD